VWDLDPLGAAQVGLLDRDDVSRLARLEAEAVGVQFQRACALIAVCVLATEHDVAKLLRLGHRARE